MTAKNFSQDPGIIEAMEAISEATDSPDQISAALEKIAGLPADARAYCADLLEAGLVMTLTSSEKKDITDLRNMADALDAADKGEAPLPEDAPSAARSGPLLIGTLAFVAENRGEQAFTLTKAIAQALAQIPDTGKGTLPKQMRAVADTLEKHIALTKKNEGIIEKIVAPESGKDALRAIAALPDLPAEDRLYIAEMIEILVLKPFQQEIEAQGVEEARKTPVDNDEDGPWNAFNADLFNFITETRGAAASPFAASLADISSKQPGKMTALGLSNLLCDAYEMAEKWPEIQKARAAAKLAAEQNLAAAGQANRDVDKLKNLRPSKPALKPSK